VERELADDRERYPRAGIGKKHAHRQFDGRWLRLPQVRLELIAVVKSTRPTRICTRPLWRDAPLVSTRLPHTDRER
jgi:hypothetical protein